MQLLAFLERNRYATFDDLFAYLRGDPTALRYTIRVLKAKPNCYIKVCDQHAEERNLRRKVAYELDKRGVELLRENGMLIPDRRYVRNFTHAALASHATGSIEAGISAALNARLITWSEILSSQNMPAETKRMEHPAGMPAAYEIDGVAYQKTVRAELDTLRHRPQPRRSQQISNSLPVSKRTPPPSRSRSPISTARRSSASSRPTSPSRRTKPTARTSASRSSSSPSSLRAPRACAR